MNSKHETSAPGGQPRAELGMSWSDSALESFLVWPLAAAALAGRANVRFLEDLMSSVSGKRSVSSSLSLPWTTSNTVALELASMRLRNFSTETGGLATLICAPYALHSATIADFAPGHSVVEALCQGGLSRVFVTDWRSATPETRYFSIDNYLADLNVAVDELGPPVDLIGLCQGGWLALVYAARFPKKVRRLVLVGAPIDIAAAESQLSRFVADVPLRMFDELVRQGEGIVHGDRMLESWVSHRAPMKRRRFFKIRRTSTRREGVNCVTDFGNGMPKRSIYPEYSTFKSSNGYSRKTRSLNGVLSPLGNRSI